MVARVARLRRGLARVLARAWRGFLGQRRQRPWGPVLFSYVAGGRGGAGLGESADGEASGESAGEVAGRLGTDGTAGLGLGTGRAGAALGLSGLGTLRAGTGLGLAGLGTTRAGTGLGLAGLGTLRAGAGLMDETRGAMAGAGVARPVSILVRS